MSNFDENLSWWQRLIVAGMCLAGIALGLGVLWLAVKVVKMAWSG